jgi:hypothetical protein
VTRPSAAIQAMPAVVATNSSRLPRSEWKPTADMRPPAPATIATTSAAASEMRRSTGCPAAREHWSIATAAVAKASAAQSVCTKSWRVKVAPHGTGQPAVQVTRDAMRKNPHDTASVTLGATSPSTRPVARSRRQAHAIASPPTTSRVRASWNQPAVGIPTAPSSET